MSGGDQRSSRERLLRAAKTLFAERGYEATTTAAIARQAKTSQSQFIKYFSNKQGVLTAICDDAWSQIADAVRLSISRMTAADERLKLVINILFSYLERDPDFRRIWLEHKPYGGGRKAAAGNGYSGFLAMVDEIVEQFRAAVPYAGVRNASALRSGLMGALFGMMDEVEEQRSAGISAAYSEQEITAILMRIVAASIPGAAAAGQEHPKQEEIADEVWVDNYMTLASKVLGPRGNA